MIKTTRLFSLKAVKSFVENHVEKLKLLPLSILPNFYTNQSNFL